MAAWMIPAAILAASAIAGSGAYFGGKSAGKAQKKAGKRNVRYQRQFAQQGVSWRVNDAMRAGLSPLAALGVSVPGFQSQVAPDAEGRGITRAASEMGQGIKGAALSTLQTKAVEADVGLKQAKTAMLGAQIAAMGSGGYPAVDPSFGIMGQETAGGGRQILQGNPVYEVKPHMVSDQLGIRAGWQPFEQRIISKEGFATFTMSVPGALL